MQLFGMTHERQEALRIAQRVEAARHQYVQALAALAVAAEALSEDDRAAVQGRLDAEPAEVTRRAAEETAALRERLAQEATMRGEGP